MDQAQVPRRRLAAGAVVDDQWQDPGACLDTRLRQRTAASESLTGSPRPEQAGSILTHGSTVASEYNIPAVLGIGIATKRIKHGQMIGVDGDNGVVALLDK